MVVALLILSAWTPSPVYASADAATVSIGSNDVGANVNVADVKLVKLTINNKTGGILYVTLKGTRSYSFAAPVGKTKYQIESGRYTYTVRSSACGGSITKAKNFKGGGSLGPYFCKK
jgi:hypothetical protein